MDDLISPEWIERRVFFVRGQRVMLDVHLAELYGVETKRLNQAVTRNRARFPEDFAFRLEVGEFADLKSQNVTLKSVLGRRSMPRAFTEQGVAMLSSVLKSTRAIEVNIAIMRTFVALRRILVSGDALALRLDEMEKSYDRKFRIIFQAIRKLVEPAPRTTGRRIGFDARPER